jgi:hypothetical protein
MKKLAVIISLLFACIFIYGQDAPKFCAAITKSGKQCSRKAQTGGIYCKQHLALQSKSSTVKDTAKIYTGSKGGRYIIKNGVKHYINK